MMIIEIILEFADVLGSWRVFLCVLPAIGLAWLLDEHWPDAHWPYFLTVPSVIGALVLGLRWDYRSS